MAKKVGVLALQGAFIEHIRVLGELGAEAFPVRLPGELDGLDGLVIPGGESTTMSRLMLDYHLTDRLRGLARDGLPIMGTCAGMILLAKRVMDMDVEPLGIMDIDVRRNAFGRQVDSFEIDIEMPAFGETPFHAVFIRAPVIERVGDGVEVLARLPDGTAVAARGGDMICSSFHPELTCDPRFHAYFLGAI